TANSSFFRAPVRASGESAPERPSRLAYLTWMNPSLSRAENDDDFPLRQVITFQEGKLSERLEPPLQQCSFGAVSSGAGSRLFVHAPAILGEGLVQPRLVHRRLARQRAA